MTFLEHVSGWLACGKRVAGPVRTRGGKLVYGRVEAAAELVLGAAERPANSIKQFFFPPHERLLRYGLDGKSVTVKEAPSDATLQIVIAARPCDAAALPALDRIFNWDCADEFYNRRRAATTVVTFACTGHDDACFCTSVGSGPSDTAGSDAMVFADGSIAVLTEKGRALFGDGAPAVAIEGPPARFDMTAVRRFLESGFEDPLWREETLACLGCGVCAYTCPACHCFDIVDEGNARGGWRAKNWDSCQFPMFTAHASGHNPRSDQGSRQRQRIYHKFQMYPNRFGMALCTGCGNCARNCPAGLGVLPLLERIGG